MDACPNLSAVLLGCPRCGGLWIDNAVSAALVQDSLSDTVTDFVRAVDEHVQHANSAEGVYRRSAEGCMACVECQDPLKPVSVEGVEIDICEAHGAFFDHMELRSYQFEKASRQAGVTARSAQSAAAHGQELRRFKHDLGAISEEDLRRSGRYRRSLRLFEWIRKKRRPD